VAHGQRRVRQIARGPELGTGAEKFEIPLGFELVPQLLVRADQHGLEGDDGPALGFDRRITGNFDQPDCFDLSIRQFGVTRATPERIDLAACSASIASLLPDIRRSPLRGGRETPIGG
jgi:hypothetical protein